MCRAYVCLGSPPFLLKLSCDNVHLIWDSVTVTVRATDVIIRTPLAVMRTEDVRVANHVLDEVSKLLNEGKCFEVKEDMFGGVGVA